MSNELAVKQSDEVEEFNDHPAMKQLRADLAICKKLRESGFLPESISTDAKALAIMMKGREMGLGPMASFAHLFVVRGQVGMDTKAVAALFAKRGGQFHPVEKTELSCTIDLKVNGGEWYRHTLTRKECDQARWSMEKNKETGAAETKYMWKANPVQMLFYRTLASGIRTVDPGCMLDILTRDEIEDAAPIVRPENEVIDGEVVDAQ